MNPSGWHCGSIYDTFVIRAGTGHSNAMFFQSPIGCQLYPAGPIKTLTETNMVCSGQLGMPCEAKIDGMAMDIFTPDVDDFWGVYTKTVAFYHHSRYLFRYPISMLHPTRHPVIYDHFSTEVRVAMVTARLTGTDPNDVRRSIDEFWRSGICKVGEDGGPLHIGPSEPFRVEIEFPYAFTPKHDVTLRVSLLGEIFTM